MKKILNVLILILLFICFNYSSKQQHSVFSHAKILYDETNKIPLNIQFSEKNKPKVESFFKIYSAVYNLSPENTFKEFKSHSDNLGQTHHRFKQYYKGIELAEVQYLLHEKNGLVHYAHGKLVHGLNLDVHPKLSEKEALQYALKYINAEQYLWENPAYISILKGSIANRKTFYPEGKLMISTGSKEQRKENFELVYDFQINTAIPFSGCSVDVNANTGEIMRQLSLVYNEDVQGYGQSNYNSLVPIIVNNEKLQNSYAHLDDWNSYGGTGKSWWFADTTLGTEGGYGNMWYQVLDTDPITLVGDGLKLTFNHRYSLELANDFQPPPEGYNDWDGMNVRISVDSGLTWKVLENPIPNYSSTSLYGFGVIYGEGKGIPGWAGLQDEWSEVTFDLSTFVNTTVQIRFAFASDIGGSSEDILPNCFGWQIDNISVSNSAEVIYLNNGTVEGIVPKNKLQQTLDANYVLRQDNRGIHTLKAVMNSKAEWLGILEFTDEDSLFIDDEDKPGVSAHWATETSLDYYKQKFDRNGFDDKGTPITSYVNCLITEANGIITPNDAQCFADIFSTFYGKGDGKLSNPVVSLDIVGHELTHGVTRFSANLNYEKEPGALNESFSDIFGTCIEFDEEETNGDWLIGEDHIINNYGRSMSNPKTKNQPDTYKGKFWISENPTQFNDFGGVHTNSGVQNYWFYLLCEGGSGINDNGDKYSVNGISIEEAEQIAYRNLTTYLMPTSQFSDSRLGSIQSAIDLFGINSPQHKAVIDAWDAVGVYFPFVGPYAENCTLENKFILPSIDSLLISTKIINPQNQNLSVKAIIENAESNIKDSIILFDDGLHQDNNPADLIFSGYYKPIQEDFFSVHILSSSIDSGYNNISKNLNKFSTAGPVIPILDSLSMEITSSNVIGIKNFGLANEGLAKTIGNVRAKISSNDSNIISYYYQESSFGDIQPGESKFVKNAFSLRVFNLSDSIRFNLDISSNGENYWTSSFQIFREQIVGIKEKFENIPKEFTLSQNYPNPFNPSTTIKYSIPLNEKREMPNVASDFSLSNITLKVYDILGREIATLVNQKQKPGNYEVEWNASNVPSGVYFYQLSAGDFIETKKMVLLK